MSDLGLPKHVVCDNCLAVIAGTYYNFFFEEKEYFYCCLSCMSHGICRHNVDVYEAVQDAQEAQERIIHDQRKREDTASENAE